MFQKITLNGNTVVNQINRQANHDEKLVKTDFKSLLTNALNEVSKTEREANQKQQLMIDGKIDDLHQVMIAAQKASITVEAAIQIQQKVIDTYNEVMRMQI